MTIENQNEPTLSPKRTDVGYKRPPVEHQFKKDGKPPPRKKKLVVEESATELFWRLLRERRRVLVSGKRRWVTVAQILVDRAYSEAEKGNLTLTRLLNKLRLRADKVSNEPEIFHHREGEAFLRRDKDGSLAPLPADMEKMVKSQASRLRSAKISRLE